MVIVLRPMPYDHPALYLGHRWISSPRDHAVAVAVVVAIIRHFPPLKSQQE